MSAVMTLERTRFGDFGGRPIDQVRLRSGGAEAAIIEYGAVVRDLRVRRRDGTWHRVVLGLNSLADYVAHAPHFGAIAGRFANRIAHGRFALAGRQHELVRNQDGRHHLHGGGPAGFGKQPWTLTHHDTASATLVHVSPDGTNGYPGTLTAQCRYVLADRTLRVELAAFTDAPTLVNLCHHSYFNLSDDPDVLDHTLQVAATHMTAVDDDLIPTGAIVPVAGGPHDFRAARRVRRTHPDGRQIWTDHNFVLDRRAVDRDGLALAGTLTAPTGALALSVWTTEPGLQVYDGFKVAVPVPGLDGARYGAHAGLCLEPQRFPDAPNHAHFPSAVLRPGELYRQQTEYRFE
jgi:aldose 1-epimerase